MSLLSELKTVADACAIPVETGVFSGVPPDLYLVITPMADTLSFMPMIPQGTTPRRRGCLCS